MSNKKFGHKYFAEGDDPLASLIGKILKGRKLNGWLFVSRLIAIDGDHLYFETRDGRVILDHRSSIEHLEPVQDEVI